jgi:hypothetical protein
VRSLSVGLVSSSRELSPSAGARLLVYSLPRLCNLQIRLFEPGEAFTGQHPPPPVELGEYEIFHSATFSPSVIVHFEGKILKGYESGFDARIRYHSKRPARRRYFPTVGWRWYDDVEDAKKLTFDLGDTATPLKLMSSKGFSRVWVSAIAVLVLSVAALYLQQL